MDYEKFLSDYNTFNAWDMGKEDNVKPIVFGEDRVNFPSHYRAGKQEAIEIIEGAIKDAPNSKAGFLQGQVLKYILRMWLKDNSVSDAKKAEWYLKRLIKALE